MSYTEKYRQNDWNCSRSETKWDGQDLNQSRKQSQQLKSRHEIILKRWIIAKNEKRQKELELGYKHNYNDMLWERIKQWNRKKKRVKWMKWREVELVNKKRLHQMNETKSADEFCSKIEKQMVCKSQSEKLVYRSRAFGFLLLCTSFMVSFCFKMFLFRCIFLENKMYLC